MHKTGLWLIVVPVLLLMSVRGGATDYTWVNPVGGTWSLTNNWAGGLVATGAANTAVFPALPGGSITMDTGSDVGTLRFLAGSLYSLNGAGTLSASSISVDGSQINVVTAPIAAATEFHKDGPGSAVVTSLTSPASVQVRNGSLATHTLSATAAPGGGALGDGTTVENSTVSLSLLSPGDYIENGIDFRGYANNFLRVAGGVNTNGAVYLNWLHAGYLAANNEIFLSAAAGGEVGIQNVDGNSPAQLVKIGAGSLKVWSIGGSDTSRSYSGGTIIRNGTLVLGEDDLGVTTNGYILPNGHTNTTGAGGSLGYNDFTNAVQLGDSSYQVTGSGWDIEGTSDSFHFQAGALTNDGVIVARVLYQQATFEWAKAGVMIRETLDAGSKEVAMMVTPAHGSILQWRDTTTGGTSATTGSGLAPYWVKLVRSGNTFTGYASADGVTWTQVGSTSVVMGSLVYVGLAVTSHDVGSLSKAIFEGVEGLPLAGQLSQDISGGLLVGSGAYIGTQTSDDVALLAGASRWIGHAVKARALGRSTTIGAAEAGSTTFAGPVEAHTAVTVTAPDGALALFSGGFSGSGSVVKSGAGVVQLAGTNNLAGGFVVSNGQFRVDASAVLPGGLSIGVAGQAVADLYGTLSGTNSLVKTGAGTLTIAAAQGFSGATVVSAGVLRLGIPGLSEGRVSGDFNTNSPNPATSIQQSTRYADSNDSSPWVDHSTYVYSGFLNNTSAVAVSYTFAENFDDYVMLRIDGVPVLNNIYWNLQSTGSVSLAPGWHSFDLRLGQGTGGVGPANSGGVDGTTGLGIAYSNAYSAGWQSITNKAGNFLDSGASVAGFLSPSSAVTVASGAMLDLGVSTQSVAGLSGAGMVTNGQLNVTGTVAPGGSGAIGTLTVKGNLSVASGAVHDWEFNGAGAADLVAVSGTLVLPSTATVNLSGLGAGYKGQKIVLYTFGNYSGPTDLKGWSVGFGASVKVDLASKQVIVVAPGTVLSFF